MAEKDIDEKLPALDSNQDAGSGMSSWFSGWYDTAKQKLVETNEFMKRDIQEFTEAVQNDASKLAAVTANTMKEKLNINVDLEEASAKTQMMKNSLTNFFGTIVSTVGPQRPTDDDNTTSVAFVGTSSGTKVLSPAEARLHTIRTDPATFCNEPDNELEFQIWLGDFNIEHMKKEVSSLMLDHSEIRSLYTKLVPSAVSHCDFWARYFFKIHQYNKAEKHRASLVERAQKTDEDIEWEDDEDESWSLAVSADISEKITMEDMPGPDETEYIQEQESKEPAMPEVIKEFPTDLRDEVPSLKEEAVSDNESKTVENLSADNKTPDDVTVPDTKTAKEIANASQECVAVLADEEEEKSPSKTRNDAEKEPKNIKSQPVKVNVENVEARETSDNQETESPAKMLPMKTPSSEESSDDWEKDFDLDMTEDEIQKALEETENVDVDDIGDDWEDWK